MKFNKLIVLSSLLFLVLCLSIGVATANENTTVESAELNIGEDSVESNDSMVSDDLEDEYNAEIIAKDTTQKYNGDNEVVVKLVDDEKDIIYGAKMLINGVKSPTYDYAGYYYFHFDLKSGIHKLKITIDDTQYNAKPVVINLKILKTKFTGRIFCKSYFGTDKTKITMKARAYNDDLGYYENGYFTFKVYGKTYKVKTKNGLATKTIRINRAGTFTYAAAFTSEKFSSSGIGKGKLYVYSTSKKARTFKVGKYSIVLSGARYLKLINAKNTNNKIFFEINTNKFIKQKYRHSTSFGKYTYKTVNARVIFYIGYGGKTGLQSTYPYKYSMYFTTRYQFPDSFCTPAIVGTKHCSVINKLNSAKTTR